MSSLEWAPGEIPGTSEAVAPDGATAFELASLMRARDASASYACEERADGWRVVCFPSEPEPEPGVWYSELTVTSVRVPERCRFSFFLFGPSAEAVREGASGLRLVAPEAFTVTETPIAPVDFGGESGFYEYDGRNEESAAFAFGRAAEIMRRLYPVGVPTSAQMAHAIKHALRNL